MASSEGCSSLSRRSRGAGGGDAPPAKKSMKYYERLVESIDVDNVKTSVWDDLRSFMTKHRLLEVDSIRKMSDESTEDYVGKITSVVEKTVSDVAAADLNSSYRSANCWGDLKAFEDRRNTSAHLGHPEEDPLLANTWGCAFDSLPKAEEREGRNMKKQRRRRRRSRSRSKIRPEDASSDVEASPIKVKMFLQANDAFDLANNGSEKTEEIPQAEDYDAGSLHFAFGEDMFIGNSETCVDYVDLDDDAVSVSSAGSSFLDLFYQAARERASIDPFGSFTKSSEYILSVGMLGLDPVTAGPTPTAMDTIQQLFDILSTPRFDEPATLPTSVVDEPPTLPSTVDKPPALPPSEEAKSVLPSGPTLPTRMVDEPPTLPSTVDKPPALPFSEEAEIVLPSGEVKKVDRSLDKNNLIEECSSSFDTAPETGNSEDGEPERERVKTIRFADERGLPMETVYMLGGPDDPAAVGRVVVLLLKPDVRKFEFIYAEYRLNSKTSVSNLLKQLPGMASSEILTAQTYSSLFRSREGCSELIGALSLQDCCLDKNEVIIGVIGGYSGQEIVKCALPLIYNDKISKTVKHAKRTGRGLKYILSGQELEEEKEKEKKRLERQQQKAAHCVAMVVMFGEYNKDCPEPLQTNPHGTSAASPYKVSETAYSSVLADYIVSDKAPQEMAQLLHAALVATIGILYSLSMTQ